MKLPLARLSRCRTFPLLAMLVACGGSPESKTATSPPEPRQAVASSPTDAKDATPASSNSGSTTEGATNQVAKDAAKPVERKEPTVRVLDPGAAPRRALRYDFKAGAVEWLEMDMKMTTGVGTGGQPAKSIPMPTLRTLSRVEAKDKTPDGSFHTAFVTERVDVLDDVKVDPAMRAKLVEAMAGVVGLRGHRTVSPRGLASDVEFELAADAPESLRETMESLRDTLRQLYVLLPEEDVGRGARWEVKSEIPLGGAMMQATYTYSLTELKPDAAKTHVDVVMTAAPGQRMTFRKLPPGATATLESVESKGAGETTIALSRLVGTGKVAVTADTTMTLMVEGQVLKMATHNVIETSLRPGKSPPAKKK